MPAATLLSAGEAFEDLVFVGLERLPALGEELKTDAFEATFGGGAVITAVAAARLGTRTTLVSGLSDDAVTRLRAEHVGVHNLRRAGERHAITAALSTATDRAFVTFNGVNAVLEPRLLRALARPAARHVHLALTPTDLPAWTHLVRRLRRAGHTVSWDFGWSPALAASDGLPALLDALDLAFLNELEAPLYARTNDLDDAYRLLRARGCSVVVKLGARGSRWLRAEGDVVMPAPRTEALDTTGAGDAFNGGFLAAWLRHAAPAACLATANAVGAASTRAAGGLDALPRTSQLPPLLRPPATTRRGSAGGAVSARSAVAPAGRRRSPATARTASPRRPS